ncbi:sigma-70 family RNA polymerase sigma factor [Streptomyces piniterrae]|uniref:Sigma-70 family RNA polymerase sigma factor n=2 Tax=Streptomyces piniterrae TaxID=2571125 RepID=A0A4U0NX19_9ACTN|nr:sigma-70 family RNA polymerase sigma factor [Streptomyces piniterrae]TJZ59337.1 sigma-70 family RNA polymerase sigma factor [Streptomyces piniterrae]
MTELPAEFRAFHQLYRGVYVHWAELYLSNRADAEEAVDQAFEQLYLAWSDVLQHENPNAYAWTVVKHRTIDYARARGKRPTVVDTAAFETTALRDAADEIGALEESLHIYEAIRALPDRQHDTIVLRYCLGYTVSETADILGVTEAGVRSTVRYARHRLKVALDRTKGEDKR